MVSTLKGAFPLAVTMLLIVALGHVRADPGNLDVSFNPGTNLGTACCTANWGIGAFAVQPDGLMLIAGNFQGYLVDNATRNFVTRLKPDGSLDSSFNCRFGTNGVNISAAALALQSDGRILVGGGFTNIAGLLRNRIARLYADGNLDLTFDPGTGANDFVGSVLVQPDGGVVICGYFTICQGVPRNRIARLLANGDLDMSFDPDANNAVRVAALQVDGKIVIGGAFTQVQGTNCNGIARLNSDGTIDSTFHPISGIAGTVLSIVIQPDGKVLIGGFFSSVNGLPCTGLARLNADGTTDTSFSATFNHQNAYAGDVGYVWSIGLQTDGKILVGGDFKKAYGATNDSIARLYADGTLETNFSIGITAMFSTAGVSALAIQSDGKVLIGGGFTGVGSITRYHAARLDGDPALNISPREKQVVLSWPASYTNFALQYKTSLSLDGPWETDTNATAIMGGKFFVTNAVTDALKVYRLNR